MGGRPVRRGMTRFAAFLSLAPLAGCVDASMPRPVPTPATVIESTTWTLRELDGRQAPRGRSPAATVTFVRGGAVAGTSACNDVGGDGIGWRPDGGFTHRPDQPMISTLVGCRDQAGVAFGGTFWSKMEQARSWTRDGFRLFITFADGSRAGLTLRR